MEGISTVFYLMIVGLGCFQTIRSVQKKPVRDNEPNEAGTSGTT